MLHIPLDPLKICLIFRALFEGFAVENKKNRLNHEERRAHEEVLYLVLQRFEHGKKEEIKAIAI